MVSTASEFGAWALFIWLFNITQASTQKSVFLYFVACSCSHFRLQWYEHEQAGFSAYVHRIADSLLTHILNTSTGQPSLLHLI